MANETIVTDDLVRAAEELKNPDLLDDLVPEIRRFIETYLLDFEQRRAFFYQDYVANFEKQRAKIMESLTFLEDHPMSVWVENFMSNHLRFLSQYKMDMNKEIVNFRHLIELFKEEFEKKEEEARRNNES